MSELNYSLDEIGVDFVGVLTIEDWSNLGRVLSTYHRGSPWMLGDWLAYGEMRADWGEKISQALPDASKLDPKTLLNYRWVCGKVPREVRRRALSFSHHSEVAAMAPADQVRWLEIAEKEKLNVADFRYRLRGGTVDAGVGQPASIGGQIDRDALEPLKIAYRKLTPQQKDDFILWIESGGDED